MPTVDFAAPGAEETDLRAAVRALLPYRGVLVHPSITDTGANISATPSKSFDTEDHDTDGFHDPATNPERVTIPAGVSKVRLTAGLETGSQTVGTYMTAMIRKWDGATLTSNFAGRGYTETYVNTTGNWRVQAWSAILEVVAGDQFALGIFASDTSVDVGTRTFLGLEVLE
jgi:hypothetical protein